MQIIRLDISYDGTAYSGLQIQSNARSIQGDLERALSVIYRQNVRLVGAVRTYAGVHARGQVAHYYAPFNVPVERIPRALNALLPADIVVTGALPASPGFHARYRSKKKIYSYTLDRAPFPQVMRHRYSLHCPIPLDLEAMRAAAALLEGRHDFRAFQASGSAVRDTLRTLYRVELKELPAEELLIMIFEGSGFLYKMVRLLTGSLLRVGEGKIKPEELAAALTGCRPDAAGPTAPPQGLCLEQVIY